MVVGRNPLYVKDMIMQATTSSGFFWSADIRVNGVHFWYIIELALGLDE